MLMRDNIKGASLMIGCMAAYAFNDALMKIAFIHIHLFQAIFLRGLLTVFLLIAVVIWQSEFKIKILLENRGRLILRTIGEIGATICFLTALSRMPLANATAIMQSVPFGITLGAAIFLKEPIGWRRWASVSFGFLGVLMIIRPGMEGFDSWSLLVLLAVGLIVLRDLVTAELPHEASASLVSLLAAIMLTITAAFFLPTYGWQTVNLGTFFLLSSAATILIFGYLFSVMAMRVGEISFIAPFRYSILLFAIFLGGILFDEYPDTLTLTGSAIVIAAGLYTVHREHINRIKTSEIS